MSKSRRKAGGCTADRFKRKKMGKGWLALRRQRGRPLPVDRSGEDAVASAGSASAGSASAGSASAGSAQSKPATAEA